MSATIPLHRVACVCALVASCSVLFASPALAQIDGTKQKAPSWSVPVTLNAEKADIRSMLKNLFQSAGISYTVDENISGTVTASFREMPFKEALQTLLAASSMGGKLTYIVRDGVVQVIIRSEPEADRNQRQYKINLNFASAQEVVSLLRSSALLLKNRDIGVQAGLTDNSVLVTGTDDQIREVKNNISMLDVAHKIINVKAEAVIVVSDKSGHKHRAILSSNGKTNCDRLLRLKTTANGDSASQTEMSLTNGLSDVRIQARINGDNSISLDGDWEIDLTWKAPGHPQPLRIHNTYNSNARARSGDTVSVSGSILKFGGDKGQTEAELLLFLTPTIETNPTHAGGAIAALDSGGVVTAIVFDFENRVAGGDEPLGTMATDAVSRALANSGQFEIIKREDVMKAAIQLGLKPPFDSHSQHKLAEMLGATAIVDGRVAFLKSTDSKGSRTASAGLRVLVHELSTEALLGAASEIASVRRSGSAVNTTMQFEALDRAAEKAAETILTTRLITGTIVNTMSWSRPGLPPILVNRGSRDGVYEGMLMDVLRDGQRVGRLKVTNVFPTDSEVRPLLANSGIAPSDKVRQVLKVPDFSVNGAKLVNHTISKLPGARQP